jgi:hypothetical protein
MKYFIEMKKTISILFVLIIIFILPACGGGNISDPGVTSSSSTAASEVASSAPASEAASSQAPEASSTPNQSSTPALSSTPSLSSKPSPSSIPNASSKPVQSSAPGFSSKPTSSSKPASSSMLSSSSKLASSSKPNLSSSSSLSADAAALLIDVVPVDRVFYGAKNEFEKGVMHGAGQDTNGFRDYTKAVGPGNHPIVYMTYIHLSSTGGIDSWGKNLLAELQKLPTDVVPQIGLEMTKIDLNAIANGKYDAQIAAFANALKNLGRPNYVRIGYEFEGSWNSYDATGYVATFKKITTALRNANTNSATVWCSGGGSAGFQSWAQLEKYYPGDSYVDWFGIDVFSPEEITDPRLKAFLAKADEHKKPVMIGETTPRYIGTLDGKSSWEKWFRPFYTFVYENPQVKMICYINWDWVYWSGVVGIDWYNWKDGRIEKNAMVTLGVSQELKKPIFVHSTAK